MVLMETGIFAYLQTISDITDVVGKRIYPDTIKRGAPLPVIVYSRLSGGRVQVMGGISGLAHPVFQITSWATTYLAVKNLAELVRVNFDAVSGAIGGVTVRACIMEDDGDITEESPDIKARRMYGVRQDYEIWHDEAT